MGFVSVSHEHGNAQVFCVTSATGMFYLKHHRTLLRWQNEVSAYETFVPAITDYTPRLVAVRDDLPRAILLTALAGTAMFQTELDESHRSAAWLHAGICLAALHELEGRRFGLCAEKTVDPDGFQGSNGAAAFHGYASHWIEAGIAAGVLTGPERRLGREALRHSVLFSGEAPRACHRDFTPRNWIVDKRGRWSGVIDFELAVWGTRAMDMDRWWDNYFTTSPECERAFFNGYGRELSDLTRHQIIVARVVNAVHQIVWGSANNDAGFVQLGREALVRLGPLIGQVPA
jgi:Ser/Thr protein kinase RdoA (MazF antagonist)